MSVLVLSITEHTPGCGPILLGDRRKIGRLAVQPLHPAVRPGVDGFRIKRRGEHVVDERIFRCEPTDTRQRGGVDASAFEVAVIAALSAHPPPPDATGLIPA